MILKSVVSLALITSLMSCHTESLTGPTQPGLAKEMDFVAFYTAQNTFQYRRCVETEAELDERVPAETPVRKDFLEKRVLTAGSERHKIVFTVSGDDLKRRMLLNLRHHSGTVKSVKASLNGLRLASFLPEQALLNAETPDMVVNLCRWVKEGENALEFEVQGSSGSEIEVFLTGLMDLAWIPGKDSSGKHNFTSLEQPGVIDIIFSDALNVSYDPEKGAESFNESSGLSLYPLTKWVQKFDVDIPPLDAGASAWFGASFAEDADAQVIMDTLLGMPYFGIVTFRPDLGLIGIGGYPPESE